MAAHLHEERIATTQTPETTREPAVTIKGLRKVYGEVEAVAGIDLTIARGEVFALLGPNGAGKTTTVEILEGYRRRSAGEVNVLGLDPETWPLLAWGAAAAIVAVRRFAAEAVDEEGSSPRPRLFGRSPEGALR